MELYKNITIECSKIVTQRYSTSFSLGIKLLAKNLRNPIYSIYGFVRFADEIVDTFHDFNKEHLLNEFKIDTYKAIELGISLNPILNSFQEVVHKYNIPYELIDTFLESMKMDLNKENYTEEKYEQYILGSAEVVGLMCLKIFTEGDLNLYEKLKPFAMKLGSAFQKINFLRDIKEDYNELGRSYFPNIEISKFNNANKKSIEKDIEKDFALGLIGIKKLPKSARFGVYLAYVYYYKLFKKIKNTKPEKIMNSRIRVHNSQKISLIFSSYLRHNLNCL